MFFEYLLNQIRTIEQVVYKKVQVNKREVRNIKIEKTRNISQLHN